MYGQIKRKFFYQTLCWTIDQDLNVIKITRDRLMASTNKNITSSALEGKRFLLLPSYQDVV
jgi:hypothetical protein